MMSFNAFELLGLEEEKRKQILEMYRIDMPDAISELSGEDLNFVAHYAGNSNVRITELKSSIFPPQYNAPRHPTTEFLDVPAITVESMEDLRSDEFRNEVFKHEICILRNVTKVVGMDLKLFSTEALATKCPRKTIEVRKQKLHLPDQPLDENFNHSGDSSRFKSWAFDSFEDSWKLHEYAEYQDYHRQEDDGSKMEVDETGAEEEDDTIWFGTNVDLIGKSQWAPEYSELQKLPAWLRPDCKDENMLSGLDFPVPGMNRIQVYLKVEGCRTPAHQENNNFCSVNVNVGPGDTEWFATPFQSWGMLNDLCTRKKIGFLDGSWWPDSKELQALGIPVYRFLQRPEDIVFVNIGCVHWVKADGVCNNAAWNVGPYTGDQFRAASARYEFNKTKRYKSIVPMKRLAWNMAKRNSVEDPDLRKLIRIALAKSLYQFTSNINSALDLNSKIQMELLKRKKETDKSFLCFGCAEEIFGVVFGRSEESPSTEEILVYCVSCAVEKESNLDTFKIYLEYETNDLINIYNRFSFSKS